MGRTARAVAEERARLPGVSRTDRARCVSTPDDRDRDALEKSPRVGSGPARRPARRSGARGETVEETSRGNRAQGGARAMEETGSRPLNYALLLRKFHKNVGEVFSLLHEKRVRDSGWNVNHIARAERMSRAALQ